MKKLSRRQLIRKLHEGDGSHGRHQGQAHPEHLLDVPQAPAALAHPPRPSHLALIHRSWQRGQARVETAGAHSEIGCRPPGQVPDNTDNGSDRLAAPRAHVHHDRKVDVRRVWCHRSGTLGSGPPRSALKAAGSARMR